MTTSARPGWVYLVGAGPGDPGLITVRGLDLVRSAEVVVHDRLVARELLAEAPPGAELIDVGKAPSRPSVSQDEISALLAERGHRRLAVVRLKGGDPFVLGRGGEEALALAEAGIPFEVVPGVTSAVAAPAYAGIPLTHRGLAAGFTVVTAHDPHAVEWDLLARGNQTLVLLMGVASLPEATRRLTEAGKDPFTPAAAVEWGTTARQRTIVGDLASIADLVREADVSSPATIVIGDVVIMRSALEWFALGDRSRAANQRRNVKDTSDRS